MLRSGRWKRENISEFSGAAEEKSERSELSEKLERKVLVP
jgi:hypothetical protein